MTTNAAMRARGAGRVWAAFAATLAAAALGCVRPGSAVGGDRQTSAAAAPVRSSEAVTAAGSGTASPPALPDSCVVEWHLDEGEEATLDIGAACPAPRGARWFPIGGPRGIAWDVARGVARYRPDFIEGREGGAPVRVPIEAWVDGELAATGRVEVFVADTIAPPAPICAEVSRDEANVTLDCALTTDAFLDSPARAGRTVHVLVGTPASPGPAQSAPVRVGFHGFDGVPTIAAGATFTVALHDDENTYWWGYATDGAAAGAPAAAVPDYTLRQTLRVLEWVLDTYPDADPARVSAQGSSMGGAGAITAGAVYARHFAWVDMSLGQTVPRNHRPSRIRQLSALYGAPSDQPSDGPERGIWDELDLTRLYGSEPLSREPLVFARHAKDDRVIQFGAAVQPSPLTGMSFYDALESAHVGYLAVWDEGGHGAPDPVLPTSWWQLAWDPLLDAASSASLTHAHVAFSGSSANDDPGSMTPRDGARWDPNAGFAASAAVPGDTGWSGAIAGARNRGLRWDASRIEDTVASFAVPLHVLDGAGEGPPRNGYPCLFDRSCATLPVTVDVTPRRAQAFRLAPGEAFRWECGGRSGEGVADASGDATARGVMLGAEWSTLRITRDWATADGGG
ncbi:MAG: hypothetical protein H6698_06595 [Myxococcales bacterium]|nr:hypothetical protein [Myxococcales bacterium]MCB9533976.1 hypothetical protein [Myxococcales bacterium]